MNSFIQDSSFENMHKRELEFSLANGYCHVLPYYLVITDDGNVNEILRRKEKNSFHIYRLIFIVSFFAFTVIGGWLLFLGKMQDSIYLFICAVLNLYFIFKWRNRSNIKVIDRSHIRAIRLTKEMFNPAFSILYKDAQRGKILERILVMDSKKPQQISDAITILCNERLMRNDLQPQLKKIVSELTSDKSGNKSEDYNARKKNADPKPFKEPKRDSNGYVKSY